MRFLENKLMVKSMYSWPQDYSVNAYMYIIESLLLWSFWTPDIVNTFVLLVFFSFDRHFVQDFDEYQRLSIRPAIA